MGNDIVKKENLTEVDVSNFKSELKGAVDALDTSNAALFSVMKVTEGDDTVTMQSYQLGAPDEMGFLCGQTIRQVLSIFFNNPAKVDPDALDRFCHAFGRSLFYNKNDVNGYAILRGLEHTFQQILEEDKNEG